MPSCRRGTIRRAAYTRKNGRRVGSGCIKNRGAPGKWTTMHKEKGIGPLKAGRLSAFGYGSEKVERARHVALNKAIAAYGATAVYRMLNAVYVYTKRTNPSKSALYKADRDWVGAAHGLGRK